MSSSIRRRPHRVFKDLPAGVHTDDDDLSTVVRDGQVRLYWDTTAVDLFFAYHRYHDDVARRVRAVPFVDALIPVLSCEDLLVFKAFFARTQDWADIEAMVATETIDIPAACERVAGLIGTDHPSYIRLLAATGPRPDSGPPSTRLPDDPPTATR